MENLTKKRFIELANEVVDDFASVNENVRRLILDDTPYNNAKNLFYMQPFSTWDEDARNEVVESINSCENEIENIEAYFNRETAIREYILDLNNDMGTNNFLSASNKIEQICSHVEAMTKEFKEQIPNLNFDMPRYYSDVITNSATKFDTQNVAKYKLENEPEEWQLELLIRNTPDLSILQIDNDYFISSNSTELSKFQIAYAFYEIDENIPKEILDSLDFNSHESKGYFFADELKKFITNKELFETEHSKENITNALSQSTSNNVANLKLN